MDMDKTDMDKTDTMRNRESGHDTRGRPQRRSLCDGHILVLCIEPYGYVLVGWRCLSA